MTTMLQSVRPPRVRRRFRLTRRARPLCPKGAASEQLVNSPGRQDADEWQSLDKAAASDMVADRFIESRRRTCQQQDDEGPLPLRTMGRCGRSPG